MRIDVRDVKESLFVMFCSIGILLFPIFFGILHGVILSVILVCFMVAVMIRYSFKIVNFQIGGVFIIWFAFLCLNLLFKGV